MDIKSDIHIMEMNDKLYQRLKSQRMSFMPKLKMFYGKSLHGSMLHMNFMCQLLIRMNYRVYQTEEYEKILKKKTV